jgi:hypothetical protein
MRPVADDYCFAASLDGGILGSLGYWYQNTQFDFFTLMMNIVFVAVPIRILDPKYASSFSLIAVNLVFVLFIYRLLLQKLKKVSIFRKTIILQLLITLIYTNFALQSVAATLLHNLFTPNNSSLSYFIKKIYQHSLDVSNSWLMWGVVNSSYVLPFILSFGFLFSIKNKTLRDKRLIIFLGTIIGTSGYVNSTTTLLYLFFSTMGSIDFKNPNFIKMILVNIKVKINQFAILILPILGGMSLSYFSPGAFDRRKVLSEISPFSINKVLSLPIDLLKILGEVLFNVGNVSSFVAGIVIGILLKTSVGNLAIEIKALRIFAQKFCFLLFLITALSEIFSYKAFWHYFIIKFAFMIVMLTAGVGVGLAKEFSSKPLQVMLLLIMTLSVVAQNSIWEQIDNRYTQWRSGEYYGVIGPANDENSWVNECFKKLHQFDSTKYYRELSN